MWTNIEIKGKSRKSVKKQLGGMNSEVVKEIRRYIQVMPGNVYLVWCHNISSLLFSGTLTLHSPPAILGGSVQVSAQSKFPN